MLASKTITNYIPIMPLVLPICYQKLTLGVSMVDIYIILLSTHSVEQCPPLESLSHSQVHVCIITVVSLGGL